MDASEMEDAFVVEREFVESNPDGTFAAGPAAVQDMPEDLQHQLKALFKALRGLDGGPVLDKRKRDEAQRAVVAEALRAVEARYATTAAEDELLLAQHAGGGLDARQRMAVQVRLGEKRLLHEARALLGQASGGDGQDKSGPQKRAKRRAA